MTTSRRRLRRTTTLVGSASALTLLAAGLAQASVGSAPDAATVAEAVVVQPASPTSPGTASTSWSAASYAVEYPCEVDDAATPENETYCPMGVSTSALAGFPTQGSSFGVLSTGNVASASMPNNDDSTSTSWDVSGAGTLGSSVNDHQVVRIDLGPATASCLAFDFKFLSEEFPEYVNAGFNDAFVAQLNTWSVNVPEGTQTLSAPGDFAAGAGDQISVDAAGPSSMTAEQAAGTTYDGSTLPLVARKPVVPGSTNTLYLTLLDQGDNILDSAVFVDNLRYEDLPTAQCKSLGLDPADGTTGLTTPTGQAVPVGANGITMPVTCTLPPGPIPCTMKMSVTATATSIGAREAASREARSNQRLAAVELASGTASIPGGGTANVTAPLTAAGQAFVAAERARPATLNEAAKMWVKMAKKLTKKAKKLKASDPSARELKKAKKLVKKAKKLKKKANAAAKQAAMLAASPLATATVTFTNTSNNTTSQQVITILR